MAPVRTAAATVAAIVAVAIGGISAWEIVRPPDAAPELRPGNATPVTSASARKVVAFTVRSPAMPQRPEPPEMRRIVQRMVIH